MNRVIFIVVSLCFLSTIVNAQERNYYADAEKAFANANYSDAASLYNAAYVIMNQDMSAKKTIALECDKLQSQARKAAQENNIDKAIQTYRLLLEKNPNDKEATEYVAKYSKLINKNTVPRSNTVTFQVTKDRSSADSKSVDITVIDGVQIHMTYVKGGTFKGRVPELGDCQRSTAKEWTLYDLSVNDYYIATTEVTQELWKVVMKESFVEFIDRKMKEHQNDYTFIGTNDPYAFGIGDKYPVYYIAKDDIKEFLMRLNQITGKHFRLPTAKEWIYAESGGNKSLGFTYSGSNNLNRVAWYRNNSEGKSHPVASKLPNELGIYDLSGNVMEWTTSYPYGSWYMSNEEGSLLQNSWRITDNSVARQVGFRIAMDY